ncbi:hypothetical protein EA71_01522 [Enterococcus durans]|uniref:Uncharacterized protein n=1 Tax=Enterococcus durans TaxID=53345 RepID=A0A367CDP1_9ENTE|nr:hypothetical protein EA71_01522 [Enterococcus durans]
MIFHQETEVVDGLKVIVVKITLCIDDLCGKEVILNCILKRG